MTKANFKESEYTANMAVSSTLAVLMEAERLRAEGADLVDLGAGEPDFPTPSNIKEAGQRAIAENFTRYTSTSGSAPLKRAVIEMMKRDFAVEYQPYECIITVGGKQGIFNAMAALVNAGDEVLIAAPYWVTFPEITRFLRATPVFIDTEATQFVLTADLVRQAITPKTKLLILNSPNNPSGRIIPPAEFRKIIEVAAEHDVWVISDECYLYFAYSPAAPFTCGSLPAELRSRVMISGSFSKSHAMTGWRVGYALGEAAWIQAMLKVQSHSTSNTSSISQQAAREAATGEQQSLQMMLAEYKRRRDWLIPALNEIEGVECDLPEGAFYAFPNIKGVLNESCKTSAEFARHLLNQAHVVVTDGAAFGAPGYLRLSYANSLENIQKAVERMKQAIAEIHR
ncbi:MAG: pyridoxal phosphate-dependent aminotransferase [Acidobacteria bacterium]|nr:pyridoxal phosphate-dependent aminotransferase [Acidobacteriota bacterium]